MSDVGGLAPAEPIKESGHPLFPRHQDESGPDLRRIDLIHIERWLDDGTKEICPKAFRAAELRTWEEIINRYGGGMYQLRAQCARTHQFQGTSEKQYFASPPPRPFVEAPKLPPVAEPPPAPTAPPPTPAAAPAPPMLAATGGLPMPPGNAMMGPFYPPPQAPQSGELAAVLSAIVRSMSEMQTLVLKAVLEMQTRAPQPPPQAPQNPLEMLKDVLPLLTGNASAASSLKEGIELAKTMMPAAQQAAAPQEDIGATLAAVLRVLTPPAAPPSTPAQPPSPPPFGWGWPPPYWYGGPPPVPTSYGYGGAPPPYPYGGAPPPYAAPPGAAPPAAPPGAASPAAPPVAVPADMEALLATALQDPALRGHLRAALDRSEAASPPAATSSAPPMAAPPGPAARPGQGAVAPGFTAPPPVSSAGSSPSMPVPSSPDDPFDLGGMLGDSQFHALLSQLAPPEVISAAFNEVLQSRSPAPSQAAA